MFTRNYEFLSDSAVQLAYDQPYGGKDYQRSKRWRSVQIIEFVMSCLKVICWALIFTFKLYSC